MGKTKRKDREPVEPVSAVEDDTTDDTEEDFEVPEVVHVGKYTVRLGIPQSIAIRYEVIGAVHEQGFRGLAACLGLAWVAGGSKRPPKTSYAASKYDPLRYGGAVLDELVERGIPVADITEAGKHAFLRMTQDLPGAREVDDAEDF